jgi:isoaspartyl peptidase/L-asparaginase-like protein (Ntn-hydrolase superfamily)
MVRTPHVLLAGEAGEKTQATLGVRMVDDPARYFGPPQAAIDRASGKHGTVGAVALDRCGALVAGTSTGGTPQKLPGRVGDTPIIGAGVYADEAVALSSTGTGEFFMRWVAAHEVSALVRHGGMSLRRAMDEVVLGQLKSVGGIGAMIGVDRSGEVHVVVNTTGVLNGVASDRSPVRVGTSGS